MVNTLIDRIMQLCGPIPNPLAHRRWLESLGHKGLQARLDALLAEQGKPATLERWSRRCATQEVCRG